MFEFFNRFIWEEAKKIARGMEDLRPMLRAAKMRYTPEEYIAMTLKYSIYNLFIGLGFFLFLFHFLLGMPFILSLIVSFSLGIVFMSLTFIMFLWYPKTVADSRKRKIENALPFVSYYMATIASSGVPPDVIFKTLAEFKEFGEISKECEEIARNIEVFGYTLIEALENAIKFSPSSKWKELLTSILTTITTGGDLGRMLIERARRYTEDFRRSLQSFSQSVSLLLEIYITVVLVGTIMTTVVMLLMGIMGGGAGALMMAQYFMALVLVPALTGVFIFAIKAMSPVEV